MKPPPTSLTPFTLAPAIISACFRVERLIGQAEGLGGATPEPKVRRQQLVRTVQATAAVEGNTLSLDQVAAVLDGKRVRGSVHEIRETKNALAAYEMVAQFEPLSRSDFLRAHATLMAGLVEDAGRYRRGDVDVVPGQRVTHAARPANRVSVLMSDLFEFLAEDGDTPVLVKACRFHFEIELIQPFRAGNGRAARLWQRALLYRHSEIFAQVPIESLLTKRQKAHREAIAQSDKAGDALAFIVFMLGAFEESLTEFVADFRPLRLDAGARLDVAAAHFGTALFSRKEYLALHKGIAPITASRDLAAGIEEARLHGSGEKATASYRFAMRRKPER